MSCARRKGGVSVSWTEDAAVVSFEGRGGRVGGGVCNRGQVDKRQEMHTERFMVEMRQGERFGVFYSDN